MSEKFVHLHVHSEFSMLDGLGSVEQYVERAKELGHPSLALTDHGNMCGAPRFYHAARNADVEPIIGSEFYFTDNASVRNKGDEKAERHHVVLLARGGKGYEVLSELSTATHRQFYYKPLLDWELLDQLGDDAQHLVCLSGCAASNISHAVRAGDMDEAAHLMNRWRGVFPHFYVELQHHGTDFDRQLNTGLIKLARKYRVPHLVTNDPHYVVEEDAHHHDVLLAIQTASDVDSETRFRFDGTGYHLRSRAEMFRAFKQYGKDIWSEGAKRTVEVARMCHTRIPQWEKRTWHIPQFEDVPDSYAELRRLTLEGLRERGWESNGEYRSRAMKELKAIKQVGIADFLLITRDCILWAIEQGIPVGPGRGSVCGTLVGFLIGIHKIDPVKYDLMFERFLNTARPSMPDIDTDFGPARRDEMFKYVAEKYGIENVVHVAAYQNMKIKAAYRSLAKSFGVPYVEANRWGKMLPDVLPEDGDEEEQLPGGFWEHTQQYPGLYEALKRLAGLKRAVSAHPAGVIIADPSDHVRKLVPEMWLASSKQLCGQYDLSAAEEMGLMKQDFLGLRTLETIYECTKLIEERTGEVLDPDSWVPDEEDRDDEVYAMLARGETAGVFQMEGPTNTGGLRQVKPVCFEDVVSTTSLYRTGAISAGFPAKFKEHRKIGKRKIKYAHPALKPILERTWGVVIYQEQVMEMGERIAGFSMEQVDDIKECIKHKKEALLASMEKPFIKGCMKHSDATEEQAVAMWQMIKGYAGYGYNRSHAVAYTFITYQTARLKCLYPKEFIAALLRTVPPSGPGKDKRHNYLTMAVRMDLRIDVPHINESDELARPTRRGIRFGFTDLAGVGPAAARKIIEGRPEGGYTSVDEVAEAVRNQGVMRVLADSGTLRCLGVKGTMRRKSELLGWQFHDSLGEDIRAKYQEFLVTPNDLDGDNNHVCLIGEITTAHLGGKTKNGKVYATFHVRWDEANTWNVRCWSETEALWARMQVGAVIRVHGRWEKDWENVSVGNSEQIAILRKAKVAAA